MARFDQVNRLLDVESWCPGCEPDVLKRCLGLAEVARHVLRYIPRKRGSCHVHGLQHGVHPAETLLGIVHELASARKYAWRKGKLCGSTLSSTRT